MVIFMKISREKKYFLSNKIQEKPNILNDKQNLFIMGG